MINSRNINDLDSKVAAMCSEFINRCKAKNIDVIITSTYRDIESQNALYAQGRTVVGANSKPSKPMGDIVTNAKGGQSYHNWKVAFDFCPIVNGKAMWKDAALFTKCGEIAESVGLEWAGRWKGKLLESAHCQYTGGLKIADFQAGKKL